MRFCGDVGFFNFSNICVRATWSAVIPAGLVFVLCLGLLPVPYHLQRVSGFIKSPFVTYLTLDEAEALDLDSSADGKDLEDGDTAHSSFSETGNPVPLWRTVVFAFVGLIEALFWLGLGSYRLIDDSSQIWRGVSPVLVSLSWIYATVRPIASPTAIVPYDLFTIYILHLLGGILQVGGVVYDHNVVHLPWPSLPIVLGIVINITSVCLLLAILLSMPVGIPSQRVKKEAIGNTVSPEDYTTLLGWISFQWVYPLVYRGRYNTLNKDDVWDLSPTIQSRPIFIKFSRICRSTLLRRLWAANSLDLILDFSLTFVSVVFNYAGPFFLKRILDAIDNPTPESRSKAHIYAFLAFSCNLMKAQADVQHLWLGRRASTRIRSELMAAIYDKALKRKDFSGIIDKETAKEAAERKAHNGASPNSASEHSKTKAKTDNADDPKAGADVGKIVNLMAGDANRVSRMTSSMYFIYGAPFEILIASISLYQLLGWSAFAGFLVLLAGWPLNNYVARRSIRIQKGFLSAKDKRMTVVNELIGAVKCIKFFAWEDRWIQRVLDARGVEIKWLIKARVNSVLFFLLWTCAPILVAIISFFTFVVQGNELTVSVAFTSIALFNMIRAPLNVIPTWIVQILQTLVALNRIATYLDEDEVTAQVSSLKTDNSEPHSSGDEDGGLGLEAASFKWNEVEEKQGKDDQFNSKHGKPTPRQENNVVEADISVVSPSTPSFEELLDHHFELRDVSIKFPEGQLTVVTGPTASGKTALLMALLGEMTLLSGRIIMSKNPSKVDENGLMHAISYAAQTPWLRHQSIKDNILFGYPYDQERYKAVIECCALKPDLEVFEDGDATEIGARGVSLSGGQKARVALARAVYARTKYVLLDDPLSAVDSHTARFLFERLLQGPLLANRTVILVTHHVELVLPGAYYLVRMLDGRINIQGILKDLRSQGVLDDITHGVSFEATRDEQAVGNDKEVSDSEGEAANGTDTKKKPRKLIQEEHRETGGVRWSIYNSYLKASSYWIWGVLASLLVVNQLLGVSEKVWIMIWGKAYGEDAPHLLAIGHPTFGDHELQVPMHTFTHPQHVLRTWYFRQLGLPRATEHPMFYVGVYAAIGLANAMATILSVIAQYTGALRASRHLFRQLLVAVVRATFRFHDTTPQGRMLNRFGKDIETIDLSLAGSLQSVNSSMAALISAILTVSFVFPLFLVPVTFIAFAYRELAIGYLNTGRDLRRMESNSRSPIFSDFGELLEGIVTVRAFSAEKRFMDNLHKKIDLTTKMWYSFWMTNRWLLLRFDALGATVVLVTTLLALSSVSTINSSYIAGLAGLCITSAMTFTTSIYWVCRMYTALELDLNSVERVVEYLDLPQEPPAIIESNHPPAYWPSSSSNNVLIDVQNLSVRYSPDLPSVLQDVSFTLKPRERIGLLGRTGSGKSTLAMSILRFVDPASGRILIDGIDISTIGIYDLRSRLTFIPQDAILFSGTLRENLDPFKEHDDNECLNVLYRVHMLIPSSYSSQRPSQEQSRAPSIYHVEREEIAPSVSTSLTDTDTKTTISLDTQVSAGGANFSQGQRQLIAMARALLRRSSIIILDEATSSIDFATDAKIQATIREEFNDSLLLTVAHRLRTVIDYDRLIILDKGKIVEFDTPFRLIQKKDGIFRNMCLKSGTFGELEAAAKAKTERDLQRAAAPDGR